MRANRVLEALPTENGLPKRVQQSTFDSETAEGLPYRLLLLDVDGTLVGASHAIAPRTLAALKEAQDLGCILALCTGRSRHTAQPVADQIGGRGYGILFSGAAVFHWQSGTLVQKRTLPQAVALDAVRLIRACEMAPVCEGLKEDDLWLNTCRSFPLPKRYSELNAYRLLYPEDLEERLAVPPITVGAYGPAKKVRPLAQACRETFGARVNVLESVSRRYDCWCVEIFPADVSKARAAQAVAGMLGISREQTLAIGDHLNDLDLLSWAGLGICMGDGHPEAQASADHITGSLADDGVALAVERFVLRAGG